MSLHHPTTSGTTLRSQPRQLRIAALLIVAILLALFGALGTRSPAEAAPRGEAASVAALTAGTVRGCPYKYLCLYEGANYTGSMHKLYTCEDYYTYYDFNSVVNNQTPGTRPNFYGYTHNRIWTSPAPLWSSPNTDGIAGNLGLRTYYVKPC